MMTCVSLRSGVASSGIVTMAYHPAMHATPINVKTASLCSTEKSMILLIIFISRMLAWKQCPRNRSDIFLCTSWNRSSRYCLDKRGCYWKLLPWQDPPACRSSDQLPLFLPPPARAYQLGCRSYAQEREPALMISAGFLSPPERWQQQPLAHLAERLFGSPPVRHNAIPFRHREARRRLRRAPRTPGSALRNPPTRPPKP